ncbi:hypothetical protein ACQV5M_00630 [Leptospira sp. SA-E8]|uniref:hypothetical protein n=1 Tax=Leptospira sp. SA-E8 TaxID=3422259 RepID=UPI003EB7A89B
MIYRIILILFLGLFAQTCMTADCSDHDRTCSPMEQIFSVLSVPKGLYLFSTPTSYDGILSILGAGNLDPSLQSICAGARVVAPIINTTCQNVIPLVSTLAVSVNNTTSFYADFPTTGVPVRGPSGIKVAADFTNFLTVDLETSLSAAGLGDISFWTYSDITGNYASGTTCLDGTDNTSSSQGYTGISTSVTAGSWFGVSAPTCDQSFPILCICYEP